MKESVTRPDHSVTELLQKWGRIKRLHAEFYAQMAETAEPELSAGKTAEWSDALEQEHDNLRFALEWSLACKPETALRIVGAIRHFWFRRGYLSEGGKWTRAALERSGTGADPKLRAKAYLGVGHLSWRQGDLKAAEPFLEESLRIARQIDDKDFISRSLGGLGIVKIQQGELSQAKVVTEEALAIDRKLNNILFISTRLNTLGEIARQQEDSEAARRFYEEALTLVRRESLNHSISTYAGNLASIAVLQGDYNSARFYALESLKASEELGDKITTGEALDKFGALAAAAGEMDKATRLWGAAQAIYDATGFKLENVDWEFNERYIGGARAAMGNDAFDEAFQEGKKMRLKKAIALARESS